MRCITVYVGIAACGFFAAGLAAFVGAADSTTDSSAKDSATAPKSESTQDEIKPSASSSNGKRPASKEKTKGEKPNLPAFSEERAAAALAFVREHHPEVADLLDRLKTNRPAQYRKAVRELSHTIQRLAQWKERDPQRYELELRLWKLQSKAQLLSARATMSGSVVDESELRQVLAEQIDVRIALVKLQRDAAARRVEDLDNQIARLTAGRDTTVQQQLTRAKQAIEKQRKRKKSG